MFKKSIVVGVSVTPEAGLEVAQIDYATKTVIKYGRKSLDYNIVRREIADFDLFKETLQDLLEELSIPKGSEIVLTLPTVAFKVTDYPASMDAMQIEMAIEEEVYENPYLKNYDPGVSYAIVNSSLQSNKVAYYAMQKSTIIEIILSIRDMGYKITTIDTSLNSLFHALVYLDRVHTEPDTNWVLLTIENSCCYIVSLLGRNFLDVYEEKISIGEVLTDAENYATVITAVEPILKNLPSKYLCVVSKTNVISAEVIANKLTYSAPIIYQEANCYKKEELMNLSGYVDPSEASSITFDIIGAGIYHQYATTSLVNFNFFNKSLGDIYTNEQPPAIFGGKIVLTNEKLLFLFVLIAAVILVAIVILFGWSTTYKIQKNEYISEQEMKIKQINEYIEQNKSVSTESFDEGDEIRLGLSHNKDVYTYYTIVGTEIPQKLWLTHLVLGDKVTIEGQADNIESIYGFFRNIKDYNPNSDVALQKLDLARLPNADIPETASKSLITTLDADFYEFCISNDKMAKKQMSGNKSSKNNDLPGNLELIE